MTDLFCLCICFALWVFVVVVVVVCLFVCFFVDAPPVNQTRGQIFYHISFKNSV